MSIEKTVSIFTSRDAGVEHPQRAAVKQVKNLARFDVLCYSHQAAWERLWEKCDFKVEGDDFSQRVLRLPLKWRRLRFKICYKNNWIVFDITKDIMRLFLVKKTLSSSKVSVIFRGKRRFLIAGKTAIFRLKKK